jgi:hypothetical protein
MSEGREPFLARGDRAGIDIRSGDAKAGRKKSVQAIVGAAAERQYGHGGSIEILGTPEGFCGG